MVNIKLFHDITKFFLLQKGLYYHVLLKRMINSLFTLVMCKEYVKAVNVIKNTEELQEMLMILQCFNRREPT